MTFDRIVNATKESHNWLTYSGSLGGERYARLTQINRTNVKDLELAWIWQGSSTEKFEATPLVVDGVLYTVQPPNDVVALDAFTGRLVWSYSYAPGPSRLCCGRVNRGLAMFGRTLFMGTVDAHLLAIDARTGKPIWNTSVANAADPSCGDSLCYAITHAPLIVNDRVIVGVAGGEGKIRGFLAAFDASSGREVWRFNTIPAPGEPGSDTWPGDSWKTGGGAVWTTGTYDPDLGLIYWGIGNPSGDSRERLGDNLYSNSVVALDAHTGALKWHYQFTPYDQMDWDAAHVAVLVDRDWQGSRRKLLLMANKNGFFYALDRETGQFLMAKPYAEVNWATGFDQRGRPVRVPGRERRGGRGSAPIRPDGGATNWHPPSYSPATGLFYIPAWEPGTQDLRFGGDGFAALRAIDPASGDRMWEFKKVDGFFSGVLSTDSGLVFTGIDGGCRSRTGTSGVIPCGVARGGRQAGPNAPPDLTLAPQGRFYALDAATGRLLWDTSLAGNVQAGPMSYAVGGRQYVAVAAGSALYAFALRQ